MRISFIGLGKMGHPMARNLLNAKLELRSPEGLRHKAPHGVESLARSRRRSPRLGCEACPTIADASRADLPTASLVRDHMIAGLAQGYEEPDRSAGREERRAVTA